MIQLLTLSLTLAVLTSCTPVAPTPFPVGDETPPPYGCVIARQVNPDEPC